MMLYPQAVLYGVTALQVLGVALPQRLQDWDNCHILVPREQYRPAREGVIVHQGSQLPDVWRTKDGARLLNPVDHWVQLHGASDDEMVEVADGLVRRQHPLLRLEEFKKHLSGLDGVAGVKQARRVVSQVRAGTDSLFETRVRLILVHGGLPCPQVNPAVHCRSVAWPYHPDMAYMDELVAVEYDGAVHVGNTDEMERDAQRRRDLTDEGWLIITVTKKQLRQPAQLVRSVETALIFRRATMAAAR